MAAKQETTKEAIKAEVIKLLKTKHIADIKVTEITNALNIHRTTFYKYYDSVYEAVEELEQDLLAGLTPGKRTNNLVSDLEFMRANKEAHLTLVDHATHEPMFRRRTIQAMTETLYRELNINADEVSNTLVNLYHSYDYGGAASLLQWWLKYGDDIDAQIIADCLVDLSAMTREYFFKRISGRFDDIDDRKTSPDPIYIAPKIKK